MTVPTLFHADLSISGCARLNLPFMLDGMAEDKQKSTVVLHPHVSEKLAEIEGLRDTLALLIEEFETLLHIRRDAILAQYYHDIGHLEHQLFCLEAAVAELRYRIGFLQKELNYGNAISAEHLALLDAEVRTEFEKTREEIRRREEELRKAQDFHKGPFLSPEEVRELKSFYRQLCKKYHPDVGGNMSAAHKKRWALLQYAYRTHDLPLLKALAEDRDEPENECPETLDALDREVGRLHSQIRTQQDRIAETVSAPPFSYEEKLSDRAWVLAKQDELRQAISVNEHHRTRLQILYEALLSSSGTMQRQ